MSYMLLITYIPYVAYSIQHRGYKQLFVYRALWPYDRQASRACFNWYTDCRFLQVACTAIRHSTDGDAGITPSMAHSPTHRVRPFTPTMSRHVSMFVYQACDRTVHFISTTIAPPIFKIHETDRIGRYDIYEWTIFRISGIFVVLNVFGFCKGDELRNLSKTNPATVRNVC